MLEHHIQKAIVATLAHSEGLRFGELKPAELENKLFDYHLKIVIRDHFVAKSEDGLYSLTPDGRRIWLRTSKDQNWFAEVAYSVLFLVIRRKSDGAWLLATRKTHPLLGKTGLMHAVPEANKDIADSARDSAKEKTGLDCEFKRLGGGFLRIYESDNLESFTQFSLLVCDDAMGELKSTDDKADYVWQTDPDFTADEMVPNMPLLVSRYEKGEPFFIEETIRY